MKIIVKMFAPRFAALVQSGAKRQTVRPRPKRTFPEVGDEFRGCVWNGVAYRSSQRVLVKGTIDTVKEFTMRPWHNRTTRIELNGEVLDVPAREMFARADGFANFAEMVNWFTSEHGLPFKGIAIYWTPYASPTNSHNAQNKTTERSTTGA